MVCPGMVVFVGVGGGGHGGITGSGGGLGGATTAGVTLLSPSEVEVADSCSLALHIANICRNITINLKCHLNIL